MHGRYIRLKSQTVQPSQASVGAGDKQTLAPMWSQVCQDELSIEQMAGVFHRTWLLNCYWLGTEQRRGGGSELADLIRGLGYRAALPPFPSAFHWAAACACLSQLENVSLSRAELHASTLKPAVFPWTHSVLSYSAYAMLCPPWGNMPIPSRRQLICKTGVKWQLLWTVNLILG